MRYLSDGGRDLQRWPVGFPALSHFFENVRMIAIPICWGESPSWFRISWHKRWMGIGGRGMRRLTIRLWRTHAVTAST